MLFAGALLTRALYLFTFRPPLESYYLGLAGSLLRTGVLGFDGAASTDFEPVYPFFLAAAKLAFGERHVLIQFMQTCVAAAGAVLLHQLTLQLTSSRRAAAWAGGLFAVHPLLIRQASAASDLAVTTTLLTAFALAFVRIRDVRSATGAGLLLGAIVLTRSMVIPVAPLAGAILLLRGQRAHAAALTLAAAVVIAPMVARTYMLSGSLGPTRSGINLYIGNSPHTAAMLPTYDLDLLEVEAYERFVRERPDVAHNAQFAAGFDAFLTAQAVTFTREHKWLTFRQKLLNVAYLFSPRIVPFALSGPDTRVRIERDTFVAVEHSVPRHLSEIVSHAVTSLVLLAGCAAGVYLRRRDLYRDAILWAIAATFVAVNAIYVPASRYMAPMQFVLILWDPLESTCRHASLSIL